MQLVLLITFFIFIAIYGVKRVQLTQSELYHWEDILVNYLIIDIFVCLFKYRSRNMHHKILAVYIDCETINTRNSLTTFTTPDNTSSEVYIGNTRHKCFLYLYLMFCKNHMFVCLLTHGLLQLFHCFCYQTPFICCSSCLNLHDAVIICIAVRYVDSEVHTHDTAERRLKDIPVLYGR